MRPLRLSIQGLRSYRNRIEIDFSEAGLIAIVGDTGAGKSSILEAMTYALYNATTWDATKVKELISDGAQTMSVVFDFQAENRAWRVHRATSRTPYPPSVHLLECLSEPGMPKVDREEAVSDAVARLVGMSWKAFKSAVILPQGQFQTLLQASPKDRTVIMDGIFRLDAIHATKERAELLIARADPLVLTLEAKRGALPEDPERLRAAAEERRDLAGRRAKELAEGEKAVRELRESAEGAGRRIDALKPAGDRLVQVSDDAAAALAALIPLDRKIRKEEAELSAALTRVSGALRTAEEKLRAFTAAGESPESLHAARQVLSRVQSDLRERVEAERERLDKEEAALGKRETALRKSAAAVAKLEPAARDAREKQTAAENALKEALVGRKDVEVLLRDCRRLEEESGKAAAELRAAEEKLARLERAAAEAEAGENAALEDMAACRSAREAAARADAAAHAAHGLKPGDSCPVCRRDLPKTFRPPEAPDQEKALRDLEAAERALGVKREEASTRRGEAAAAHSLVESDRKRKEAAERTAHEGADRLLKRLPGADLARPDAEILAPLAAGVAERDAAARAAREVAEAAASDALRARGALDAETDAVAKDTARVAQARTLADGVEARCRELLAGLPSILDADLVTGSSGIDAVKVRLEERIAAVLAVEKELERVRTERSDLSTRIEGLRKRRDQEIDAPRRKASQTLDRLSTRLADVLDALGLDRIEARPAGEGQETLEDEERRARELDVVRCDVSARLLAAIEAAHAGRTEALAAIGATLARLGCADAEDLEKARIEAAAAKVAAERERAAAERQVPLAAELDRRLERGRGFVAALRELRALLADGKFVQHVVERRQKNLLAVASEVLSSMTAGRYGFAPDFLVIDRVSNQPRSTKTLSGGESFLASLALALGLVEIAGRAGGRLDALFLDEGFGALDANALDEALSALEARARSGKLVAIVSHLKAIAERIETVLVVKRTASGSDVRWAGPGDRDEMVEQEVEAGLLS